MSTFDIAIVGGGLIGLLAAREAIYRNPEISVAILESERCGSGTLARSAGMLLGFSADSRVATMVAESAMAYDEMALDAPGAFDSFPFFWAYEPGTIFPSGSIHLPIRSCQPPATGLPELHDASRWQWLSMDGARRVRTSILSDYLVKTLIESGRCRILHGRRVEDVQHVDGKLRLDTPLGPIIAYKAVVAPGPWILDGPFSDDASGLGVRVKKVISFHIPIPTWAAHAPVGLGYLKEAVYICPADTLRHWIISVTSDEWDVSPAGRNLQVTERDIQILEDVCVKIGLARPDVSGASVFADSYSSNAIPIVTAPSRFGGQLALCTATSGYGVKVGPALAARCLDAIDMNALTGIMEMPDGHHCEA